MQEINLVKKDWLNPLDVEKEYSISKSTLAKWRMNNKYLSYSKVGKYIKYKRSDIETFLNNNIVGVA